MSALRDMTLGRTCQVTGLKVDKQAERLLLFNAVTAVLWLAAGGTLALLTLLTRWDSVGLITDSEWFYRILGAHGAAMLLFWILFFEAAGLIFGGTILLSRKMWAPKLAWLAYLLMLFGSIATFVIMLSGHATVMFTAYPPLEASHWFYLFVLIFAVGALLAVLHFLVTVVQARLEGMRSLPLFTYALVVAAVLALFTLVSGVFALVPAWAWRFGLIDSVDPGMYRLLFWGFGHGAQQVNLAAMVGIWYALATLTTGARPINESLSRGAFLLYVLFIQMGSMHHILVDPGLGEWARGINTSYFLYAAVLGSMIHAFTIPASVEVAQRKAGRGQGLLGWLKAAPWSSPAFAAFAVSFALFGILGGISGVILGGVQINMIGHNTLIVPAHFHMTVVAGSTLAFMGISYILVPLIVRRDLFLPRLARWQPYVFGLGMTIFGFGMGFAGHAGVPRRHFDITFNGLPLANGIYESPAVAQSLMIMGIGGLIAITAGAMFVLVAAGTVFIGKRNDQPDVGGPLDAEALAPESHDPVHEQGFEAPGTFFLATVWLALFALLYGYSWYELSKVSWIIGN